jgi:hypothetical protein
LLALANKSYEFRQPVDATCLVVFLVLWTMAKPDELSGHRLVAFCVVLFDGYLMFKQPIGPVGMLLVPLALIWFSEFIGGMRGMVGNCATITSDTPGWMIAGFGWIVLLVATGLVMHECFGWWPAS